MIKDEEIQVPVWTKSGGMRVRRDYLEPEHPESTYNYIKNVLGLEPELYGFYLYNISDEEKNVLDKIPLEYLNKYIEMRYKSLEIECNFG